MDKKVVYFDRNGESGNIFYILSMVAELLDKKQYYECATKVFQSNSYEEALGIIEEYVHFEDFCRNEKVLY